jgi:hypothetical protein
MRSLEDRARAAYFRRFGPEADIPSVSVDERAGIVELYNVNGVLGAYRSPLTGRCGGTRIWRGSCSGSTTGCTARGFLPGVISNEPTRN